MNFPVKPWEMASSGLNGVPFPNPTSSLYVSNTDRLHSSAVPFPGTGGGSATSTNQAPPPLPPRPNQTRPIYSAYNRGSMSMMPYSSYSSPYGVGGYSSAYGGYSPYSPYSSYSSGGMFGSRPYSGYEQGGDPTFSQLAEESSASAFQSIQSFVSAFGSISMMLESTFHALYSSFRAVVGVADHLGRVKQVISALAIFRFFKWTFRRIMYLIGISKIKPETIESLWSEVAENLSGTPEDVQDIFLSGEGETAKGSSWPILMFLGFIFAGPYLMWKLLNSLKLDGSQTGAGSKMWASGESEHFVAEVKYSFDAGSDRELNLKTGQTIRLAPAKCQPKEVRGWALASDGAKIGLVPLNYIKVMGKRPGKDSLAASRQFQAPKPRVRFDLNPRPPESSCPKSEPTGILVRNGNHVESEIVNPSSENNSGTEQSSMENNFDTVESIVEISSETS
ncbi:Peroxisomal membrane protein PEX13 [Orchesella cincta]|uniref:Peroxisomal membrane protein PEX13 n=1 Tax=Orchesella cincta TaxID=48709 RepID=A0A1D2NE58_ORCCI|nr:Peroxisomal membrane protein PEX13 [Orchesella cincta]